jgi:HEAT repeat protein
LWALRGEIFVEAPIMKATLNRGIVISALVGAVTFLGACDVHDNAKDEGPQALYAQLDKGNPHERETAAMEIGKRGQPEGKAALIAHLNDPDPKVQIKIIHALAVEMYDREAAPAILPLIHSGDFHVAQKAITALVHLEYREAIPELTKLRDSASDPHVVRAASSALVHFGER